MLLCREQMKSQCKCAVDRRVAMSKTSVPQLYGSGKAFQGEAQRDGKGFLLYKCQC